MQYSITQKVRYVFFASLLFIFAIYYLSYTSITQLIDTSAMVNHTQRVITTLGQLQVSIREAESNQRGFLLTNDTLFLSNYKDARTQTYFFQQELEELIQDNPAQQKKVNSLTKLIQKRFEKLDGIIRQYSQAEPFSLQVSGQTMLEVKALTQSIKAEEYRLLGLRSEREQHYASRALRFIILISFISLCLMLGAYSRIRKDVKKRMKAEQILEENNHQLEHQVEERTREISRNEERYRFMAESIPHIVWSAKANGDFDFYSKQWADYTGASLEGTLGWGWGKYIHPEDLAPTLETWKNMLENQYESRLEHRILGKDGIYRWMQTHAVPYINEEGKLTKWFGTTTLIDDEIKAKEAARQKEELLKDITNALPVLISYMDREFRYQFVNKTYESWFKLSQEEMINQYASKVIGEEGFAKMKPFAEEALSGKQVNAELETIYPHLGTRHIRFNLIPRLENKVVIGIYILVDDITALKIIETELREALLETETKNKELKRINQVLDDFVFMAAHDLKSPVSNLKLSASLFNKLKKPEEKLKVFNHLEKSINRLDMTLSGLLEIVEVQHVKDAKVIECQFQSILDEAMVNLKESLAECGGKLLPNFEEAPSIQYIRPYLVSIIYNLVSNAIKYRSLNRPLILELYTKKNKGYVIFLCKDNGTGMDLEKVGNKLFKPFKRFSTTVEGTGVGLHLIKNIIERNGGTIEADSQVDIGTSFKCYLKNL